MLRGPDGTRLASIGVWLWGGSAEESKYTTTALDGTFSFIYGDGAFTLIVYIPDSDAYVGWYSEDSPGGFTTHRERATEFHLNGEFLTEVTIRLPEHPLSLRGAMAADTVAGVPIPGARPTATTATAPTPRPTARPTPTPPARIQGAVVGPDGGPATGIGLWLWGSSTDDSNYRGFAEVSSDGTFATALGDGAFTIQLWVWHGTEGGSRSIGWYGGESGFTIDREHATEIVVDGADVTDVEIRLPAGIRGTVLDPNGDPATAIGLQLEGESVDTTG